MKNARLLVALAAPLASFACSPTPPLKAPEKPVASAAANKPTTVPVAKHPLLQAWQGPYDGVPPWKSYTQSVNQFEAAIDEAIAIWLAEVDAIVANDAAPTFDNTLLALEMSGQHLDRITRNAIQVLPAHLQCKQGIVKRRRRIIGDNRIDFCQPNRNGLVDGSLELIDALGIRLPGRNPVVGTLPCLQKWMLRNRYRRRLVGGGASHRFLRSFEGRRGAASKAGQRSGQGDK